MIREYRDLTCDGCLAGWTLSEGEDPGAYMRLYGWIEIKGAVVSTSQFPANYVYAASTHFCRDCQAKGKATEQMELSEVGVTREVEE